MSVGSWACLGPSWLGSKGQDVKIRAESVLSRTWEVGLACVVCVSQHGGLWFVVVRVERDDSFFRSSVVLHMGSK